MSFFSSFSHLSSRIYPVGLPSLVSGDFDVLEY
jgi:hypothetical protein